MRNDINKEIEQKLAKLNSLRPINAENVAKINQKIKLDTTYHSNHLEGNTLTFNETRSALFFGTGAVIAKPNGDISEILNFFELFDYAQELAKEPLNLTQNLIRELHQLMFVKDFVNKDGATILAGQYKKNPNHVRTQTGEIFRYAEPEQVVILMQDLLDWYNNSTLDPVTLSSIFQYKFIRIHPFGDGNGRLSRLLGNLILQNSGLVPAIVKAQDRDEYLNALMQTDANFGDHSDVIAEFEPIRFEPFINCIAKAELETLDLYIRGASGEDISEIADVIREMEIKAKSHKKHYSLQEIEADLTLKKQADLQLKEIEKTIDLYIEKVLRNKFWEVKKKILKKKSTELQIWEINCEGPIKKDVLAVNWFFKFDLMFGKANSGIIFNMLIGESSILSDFKYLDPEFDVKLKNMIVEIDREINEAINQNKMPF